MKKVKFRKKNKIAKYYFFISCSFIIIFYIYLFQGRALVSVTWPKQIAQMACISKGYRNSVITSNEKKNIYMVSFIYTYNGKKYDGYFTTKSELFDSNIKYFIVRVNPKNPDEALFDKPSWTVIIIFFIIATFLFGIGFVNILEKNKGN